MTFEHKGSPKPLKVFVTGGSRGIGKAVADALSENYNVISPTREQLDVSNADSVREYFRPMIGDQDVYALIHCAGVARMELVLSLETKHMQNIVQTNLLGTMFVNKFFGQILMRRKAGHIINLSSIAVPLAIAGEAPYAASKAGVESWTRTFAREMAPFGVKVNAVAPGPVDTDMTAPISGDKLDRVVSQQIVQRKALPSDIAALIGWLLNEPTGLVTGKVINVGGV